MTDKRKDELFEKWHFEITYDRLSFKEGMKLAFIAGMNASADISPTVPDDVAEAK